MEKQKIRISQCMIVKNEEENIQKALSWGKSVMYEQIVVDTGSTDRTVELAEAMGVKVYHFPWIDDFSAAKNFALSKASGNWIAFLDADEYLTEEWVEKLVPFLERVDKSSRCAVHSLVVSIDKEGNTVGTSKACRFFKRLPELLYQNPVHEVLALRGVTLSAAQMEEAGNDFPVYHTGYDPEIMEKKKKMERNIRLLEKELEKRPDDYNVMGYLGDCHNKGFRDNKKAEVYYRMAVERMPKRLSGGDERSAATLIRLMAVLADRGDEQDFYALYVDAASRADWVYDFDYMAGTVSYRNSRYAEAAAYLERALQIAGRQDAATYGIYMNENIAGVWEMLAICHYETGNLLACVRVCVMLLKADNSRTTTLAVLLRALQREKPEDIVRFLGNFYDVRQPLDRIQVLKGAVRAQADAVLELVQGECTPEELEYLKRGEDAE